MASTRLNASMKNEIQSEILVHGFADRATSQIRDEFAFIQTVFDEWASSKMYQICDLTAPWSILQDEIPQDWLTIAHSFKVEFGNVVSLLSGYQGLEKEIYNRILREVGAVFPKAMSWKIPPRTCTYCVMRQFRHESPFTRRFEQLRETREALVENITTTKASTRGVLDGCRTVQELIKLWPEIEGFARKHLNPERKAERVLPVVARQELNADLGLPPGEVE